MRGRYNVADHWMDLLVVDDLSSSLDGTKTDQQTEELLSPLPTTRIEDSGSSPEDGFDQYQFASQDWTGKTARERLISSWDDEKASAAVVTSRAEITALMAAAGDQGDELKRRYEPSYWTQFVVLTHRSLKNGRSALFTPVNFVKSVILGLIVGCCWFQVQVVLARQI